MKIIDAIMGRLLRKLFPMKCDECESPLKEIIPNRYDAEFYQMRHGEPLTLFSLYCPNCNQRFKNKIVKTLRDNEIRYQIQ